MNISRSLSILGALALSATATLAAPLPTTLVTTNVNLTLNQVTNSPYYNVVGSLGAGGFIGTFAKGSTTAQTTVWCVDSQLFTTSGTVAANVTSLSIPGSNASEVRYGNTSAYLSGNTSNRFVYDAGLGANDTALNRYRMASYLISRYGGFPAGPVVAGGMTDVDNDNVQRAIWKLIYNNTSSTPSFNTAGISSGANFGGASPVDYWITEARNFALNASNANWFSNWAVVSWSVTASGNSYIPGSPGYQTFLVQVVPEPGFYGLLTLGLGGLFLAARRRRTQQ